MKKSVVTKISRIFIWIAIAVYLFMAFGFVAEKSSKVVCKHINVIILDSTENAFIQREDIIVRLNSNKIKLIGYPLEYINTDDIEKIYSNHPSLQSAQIYKTINGNLNIIVDQRNPIVRVYSMYGKGFYIDENGGLMPLSPRFASHVLVANGEVNALVDFSKDIDVFSYHGATIKSGKVLQDIYYLSKFLHEDRFWNAQIEQIYVTNKLEYELIPRIGSQIILPWKHRKYGNEIS